MSGWRKASASSINGCVQVHLGTTDDPDILIRDSNDPGGCVLRFTPHEWAAFIDGVRGGEFDMPEETSRHS